VSPEAPGGLADEAEPSGATFCSVNKRHRLTPSSEQNENKYGRGGSKRQVGGKRNL